MLSLSLQSYFRGYLLVRISGVTTEKLINLCTYKGIYLWDIKLRDEYIVAKILIYDFKKIRPLIHKTHCKIAILKRYGWPFFLYRMRYRKMLIAGGMLFCLCLYTLSSFVWFVEVNGLVALPSERILEVAREAGLKSGVAKKNINLKQVEQALAVHIPEISWTGVTIQGTRAVIEVAEKKLVSAEDKSPAQIVAAKDGLMQEIIALVGEAAVQRGETVRKGQVLINGYITPKIKDASGNILQVPIQQLNPVRAQGIAKARIWYQAYGESGMVKQVRRRTGRTYTHVVLKAGDEEKIIKEGMVPFGEYEVEEATKKLPSWRNKKLPVETSIITFFETETTDVALTPDEAREEAKQLALEALQKQLPIGVQVLSRNIEVIRTSETNLVRIKVVVETLEDIGHIQKINNAQ